MKPDSVVLGQLFYHRHRFAVPIYQRHYVWSRDKQWEPFWFDVRNKAVERLEGRRQRYDHYMGAVVLEAGSGYTTRKVPTLHVIDGQQRLTTFQIFLAALRDAALEHDCETEATDLERYIFNTDEHLMEEPEVERYKLWLTRYDRQQFTDILEFRDRQKIRQKYRQYFYKRRDDIYQYSTTPKLLWSYIFFLDRIKEFLTDDSDDDVPSQMPTEERIRLLWQALLEDFRVVEIRLQQGDDAQVIFETLNERGEPLLAADLVRNYVFYRIPGSEQHREKVFEKHWRPFEEPFWSEEDRQGRFKKPRLEFFLANYLSAQTAHETNIGKLFSEYKRFVEQSSYSSVVDELKDLGRFRPLYMRLVKQDSTDYLSEFGRRLAPWDVTTINPLVLRIAAEPRLGAPAKKAMLRDLLSFVVRRAVCGLTTKNYNKFFLQILRHIETNGFSSDVLQAFLLDQHADTTIWPDQHAFKEAWCQRPLYADLGSRRVGAVLVELEKAMRTKFNEDIEIKSKLSIEHIMPEKWEKRWPLSDGSHLKEGAFLYLLMSYDDDDKNKEVERREKLKHTLGNLTLLTQPLNSRLSNGPFEKKRPEIAKQSALALNRQFQSQKLWNEETILRRSQQMFTLARAIWPRPERAAGS